MNPVSKTMRALLPGGVAVVEMGGEQPDVTLFPEEARIIGAAALPRRLDFMRGRSCAHRALAMLGVDPTPILGGERGAPIWPAGVVGSITHCRDYACAVVAHSDQWSAIGIDAEPLRPFEPALQRRILRDPERQQLAAFDPAIEWPCVVFSIKEAIYKAWFPKNRRFLEFDDVEVHLAPAGERFVAQVLGTERVEGRFCCDAERVLAVVVMP